MRKTIEKKKESAADEGPCYIKCLPPEMMEEILLQLSVRDVVNFGATCTTYYQLCQSSYLWRKIYNRIYNIPALLYPIPVDYRYLSILRTLTGPQALHIKTLGRNHAASPTTRVTVEQALGYRRVMPTSNTVVLLDYQGTLFLLRRHLSTDILSTDILSTDILCHGVIDFDVHCRHIYALLDGRIRVFQDDGAVINNLPIETEIETASRFTQIRYSGKWAYYSLLLTGLVLLTDSGKVYYMFKRRSTWNHVFPSHINLYNIRQIHTTVDSALFLTAEGEVKLEVGNVPVYRQLLWYQETYCTPVPLPVPYKVVKCSIRRSHLCLIDEYGHIYTRGYNDDGQLGTGDRKYRSQPTQVALSMTAIDVWCGVNRTLALLQGASGLKEVHGCGSGTGGRLPGWSEGSTSFVKLNVQVPADAHSLCASGYFLYVLSGPDVTEYLHPPPQPVAPFLSPVR